MSITRDMLLSVKNRVDSEAEVVEHVYSKMLGNYMESIDEVVTELEEILKGIENGDIEQMSNEDLEVVAMKLPILMYRIGSDIERIGVRFDVVEAIRDDKHNEVLLGVGGTVADRKAVADREVKYEEILENAYKRLYKQIDRKLDYADKLYNSVKKVLSLRIKELEVFRRENATNNKVDKMEEDYE